MPRPASLTSDESEAFFANHPLDERDYSSVTGKPNVPCWIDRIAEEVCENLPRSRPEELDAFIRQFSRLRCQGLSDAATRELAHYFMRMQFSKLGQRVDRRHKKAGEVILEIRRLHHFFDRHATPADWKNVRMRCAEILESEDVDDVVHYAVKAADCSSRNWNYAPMQTWNYVTTALDRAHYIERTSGQCRKLGQDLLSCVQYELRRTSERVQSKSAA